MLTKVTRTVTLPDGKKAALTSESEVWWTQDDAMGYLDPRLLAPDPSQPRKKMSEAGLAELEMSIATCGVREAITITPRHLAPWIRLDPKDETLPFIIVSGHRRTRAALKGSVPAVPVRIRIYSDENAHCTDGSVLNACREDLTELEQGFDFVREQAAGKTIAEIASAQGISPLTVMNRMNLTKLHPDLWPLLEADPIHKRRVLPVYPAGRIGAVKAPTSEELARLAEDFADFADARAVTGHASFEGLSADDRRFALQKLLVAVIVNRRLSSPRAVDFIHERTLRFRSAEHSKRGTTRRYEPARRKETLLGLANQVSSSVIVDWKFAEFKRILEHASREEVDEILGQLAGARDVLQQTVVIVTRIRDSKRETPAEVLALVRRRKTPA